MRKFFGNLSIPEEIEYYEVQIDNDCYDIYDGNLIEDKIFILSSYSLANAEYDYAILGNKNSFTEQEEFSESTKIKIILRRSNYEKYIAHNKELVNQEGESKAILARTRLKEKKLVEKEKRARAASDIKIRKLKEVHNKYIEGLGYADLVHDARNRSQSIYLNGPNAGEKANIGERRPNTWIPKYTLGWFVR